MTAVARPMPGASPTCNHSWDAINWHQVKQQVHRLQMRIAKAVREGRQGKVKSLQWLLVHSYYPKLLAIKRVTGNKGKKTPGVDGITWPTKEDKMLAVKLLQRRGYKTQPLRRIYIPKKDNCSRPLSIPTMRCRAMQALHLLALEPVAEMQADKNSYGFRPRRCAADAIEQCFCALARKPHAQWILEGDIKSCFCSISCSWLLNKITMDKKTLEKWLTAGYFENEKVYETKVGIPQGGVISPTILTMTLSGLEDAVNAVATRADKVHVIIYADDFVITGASKEILENKVKPVVIDFLAERGLELSQQKTKITSIHDGFDFLGFNVRKYNGKMLIKPSKKSIRTFLQKIRRFIKSNKTARTETVIWHLNRMITGWTNYYRHVVSQKAFEYIDYNIYQILQSWIKRRHPNKSAGWRRNKYYRQNGGRNWIFYAKFKSNGKTEIVDLVNADHMVIKRHIKIRGDASPYKPEYKEYLEKRKRDRWTSNISCPEIRTENRMAGLKKC
jgi:RNA-directed DNA polymerase